MASSTSEAHSSHPWMETHRGLTFRLNTSSALSNVSMSGSVSPNETWNTTWNVTSTQDPDTCDYMLFRFVLYVCVMGVVCFLGFIGNISSFIVLRKDGSSPVAHFQLQALAVADNALLFFWVNHFTVGYFFKYEELQWQDQIYIVRFLRVYGYPFVFMAQMQTIWLTVMIAINRYIVVRLPLRARLLCTARRVRIQVLLVTAFSVLYNVPRFFEIRVLEPPVEEYFTGTELFYNPTYILIYYHILYNIFTFALPLALLAFFNTSVMIAYYSAFNIRRGMITRREHNENNLTFLMIVIILVFIICQAPARIVQLVWNYNSPVCTPENYVHHFSATLEAVNSSVNCLVYFTFRSRFRRILLHTCCPWYVSKHKHSNNHVSENNSLHVPLSLCRSSSLTYLDDTHHLAPPSDRLRMLRKTSI